MAKAKLDELSRGSVGICLNMVRRKLIAHTTSDTHQMPIEIKPILIFPKSLNLCVQLEPKLSGRLCKSVCFSNKEQLKRQIINKSHLKTA